VGALTLSIYSNKNMDIFITFLQQPGSCSVCHKCTDVRLNVGTAPVTQGEERPQKLVTLRAKAGSKQKQRELKKQRSWLPPPRRHPPPPSRPTTNARTSPAAILETQSTGTTTSTISMSRSPSPYLLTPPAASSAASAHPRPPPSGTRTDRGRRRRGSEASGRATSTGDAGRGTSSTTPPATPATSTRVARMAARAWRRSGSPRATRSSTGYSHPGCPLLRRRCHRRAWVLAEVRSQRAKRDETGNERLLCFNFSPSTLFDRDMNSPYSSWIAALRCALREWLRNANTSSFEFFSSLACVFSTSDYKKKAAEEDLAIGEKETDPLTLVRGTSATA
jgi:hypothetical protein